MLSGTRPLGVSILAVLEGLGGLLSLVIWYLIVVVLSAVAVADPTEQAILNAIVVGSGAMLLVIGIISLLVAYAMWTGNKWGYYLSMFLWILNIISGNYILPLIFIAYFLRKNVQDFFDVHVGWSWG